MRHLLFLLVFISGNLPGQVKNKEVYTVYVNYPDHTVKMNVLNSVKKIDVKETLTYYWYSSNRIMETQGGYDGKMLNGLYTSFYLSGNLKEKGMFKKGLKDGEWTAWYENGKIREIINWNKGIKNGLLKTFDDKGNLISESFYKNGKLNGTFTSYENGKAKNKIRYKNGNEIPEKLKKEDGIKQPVFKEKAKSIFKRKKETDQKQFEEKGKTPPPEKPKKSFKEKFKNFFKKKEVSTEPGRPINPAKPTKKKS